MESQFRFELHNPELLQIFFEILFLSFQGLYHTQVLQLLLSSQEHVTLRATPLKNTSIQVGGRKREPGQSKMAKKVNSRPKKQKSSSDKKRRASLFRRISSKIANAEIQQV